MTYQLKKCRKRRRHSLLFFFIVIVLVVIQGSCEALKLSKKAKLKSSERLAFAREISSASTQWEAFVSKNAFEVTFNNFMGQMTDEINTYIQKHCIVEEAEEVQGGFLKTVSTIFSSISSTLSRSPTVTKHPSRKASVVLAQVLAIMMYKASILQVAQFGEHLTTYEGYDSIEDFHHPLLNQVAVITEIKILITKRKRIINTQEEIFSTALETLQEVYASKRVALSRIRHYFNFDIAASIEIIGKRYAETLVESFANGGNQQRLLLQSVLENVSEIILVTDGVLQRKLIGISDSLFSFILKAYLDNGETEDSAEVLLEALVGNNPSLNLKAYFRFLIADGFELVRSKFSSFMENSKREVYSIETFAFVPKHRDGFAIEAFFETTKSLAKALGLPKPKLYSSSSYKVREKDVRLFIKGNVCYRKEADKWGKWSLKVVAYAGSASSILLTFGLATGPVLLTAEALHISGMLARGLLRLRKQRKYEKNKLREEKKERKLMLLDWDKLDYKLFRSNLVDINMYLKSKKQVFRRSWLGVDDFVIPAVDNELGRLCKSKLVELTSKKKKKDGGEENVDGTDESVVDSVYTSTYGFEAKKASKPMGRIGGLGTITNTIAI